jgi:hypothetical protein
MAKPSIETVDAEIQKIDDLRDESIRRYLEPLVQAELNRVHKAHPEVTGILFGMGAYVIQLEEESRARPEDFEGLEALRELCERGTLVLDDMKARKAKRKKH